MSFGVSTRNSLGLGLMSPLALTTRRAGASTPALAEFNYQTGVYLENGVSYALASAPGWVFSRTTVGYGTDSSGVMTSFAIDAPRITDLGLLIEDAATNLVIRSEATVAQLLSSGSASNVTAPAVVPFTADNWLGVDNSGGVAWAYQRPTLAATTAYNVSIFVDTPDGTQPVLDQNQVTGDFALVLDATANTATNVTYTRLAGNVWRVSATVSSTAGGARNCGPLRAAAQNTRTLKFTGLQVTAVTSVSSYIKTAGTTVAREADVAELTRAGATSARVAYTGGSATPTPATPLDLGASSAGAWVGSYIQSVVVR